MQIVMVGTGSAFAKEFYNNSALIMAENYTLLVDCGATTPLGLHKFDKDAMGRIDGVIISHIHGDHVNGLEELAFQMKYKFQKKIDLFVPEALYHSLWETLRGGLELTNEGRETIHHYFNVHLLKSQQGVPPHEIAPGLKVRLAKVNHVRDKHCYSFIFNEKLWYSADTTFNPTLIESLDKICEVIFHDCQLFTYPGQVHASLDELLTLPEKVREKMILMHYGDEMEDHYEKAKAGRLAFARQGHVYEFNL